MRLAPLVVLITLACAPTRVDVPAKKPAARPPVVVALVIDQQSAWAAAERWPTLPASGGLARLRREGALFTDVRYAHAVCDTAPGHAAIHTGFVPRVTGIVANERVEDGKLVPFLRDPKVKLVDDGGPTELVGSSIAALKVDTLADRFVNHVPGAEVVSVSIKDRAAIFGGGHTPSATLWFDAGLDRFVTSTAFASSLPSWARPHATHEAVRLLRSKPWELTDPVFVAAHAATADDAPGEGDLAGLGVTFPHVVAQAGPFRASPYADEAVLGLAAAALAARDPKRPMLLSVSLSAHDYVTHVFGPDSFEAWDLLVRLDASLARFFDRLDAAVGPDGWSIVLTGDHGSAPMPELTKRPWCGKPDRWERPCEAGQRIDPDALRDALDVEAAKLLGPGRWIDGVADPLVVYTDAARSLPPEKRTVLDARMVSTLRATPGVHSVHVVRAAPASCPSDESLAALVCRSVRPDGPGDLYVVARPGSFFDTRYVLGKGQNHGSPWLFDRTVPLLVRAPGRVAAGAVKSEPVAFGTTARALAALLGVPADPAWSGVDAVPR